MGEAWTGFLLLGVAGLILGTLVQISAKLDRIVRELARRNARYDELNHLSLLKLPGEHFLRVSAAASG